MAVLVASELVQDVIAWQVLVQERLARWQRRPLVLSRESKELLKAKLFPPLLASREAAFKFMAPLWVAGCMTNTFVWGPVDSHVYNPRNVSGAG